MFYPEDFKNRVKKAYPDFDELHRRLDNGDVFVGLFLKDDPYPPISFDAILAATSLEELQEKAKIALERMDLACEWEKLYDEQNPH